MDSKFIETGLSLLGNLLKKIHAVFHSILQILLRINFTHYLNLCINFMHFEGYNLY